MTQHESDPQAESRLEELTDEQLGLAGRTARFFIDSPLSPLLYIAMMLMGVMGLIITPRQEDPQISVPMIDIFVQYPGADAQQVSTLAIGPLELGNLAPGAWRTLRLGELDALRQALHATAGRHPPGRRS